MTRHAWQDMFDIISRPLVDMTDEGDYINLPQTFLNILLFYKCFTSSPGLPLGFFKLLNGNVEEVSVVCGCDYSIAMSKQKG